MSTFETKEQYLNYLEGWKAATNAEEAKSKRLVCDHVQYMWNPLPDEERARLEERGAVFGHSSFTIPNGGHYKDHGWLNAEHYVFNNVMRGKDPKRGFHPKGERKLQYPQTPWYAFVRAVWQLEYIIKDAQSYTEHLGKGKGHKSLAGPAVKKFLEPFGGKVKIADLLRIDVEELAKARKFHR